ncbi:hypothetical protein Tco_1191851 [Tanacetum coccineum]
MKRGRTGNPMPCDALHSEYMFMWLYRDRASYARKRDTMNIRTRGSTQTVSQSLHILSRALTLKYTVEQCSAFLSSERESGPTRQQGEHLRELFKCPSDMVSFH